jgi:hypothetical protein
MWLSSDLFRVCKRATGSGNVQYTLNYIDIHMTDKLSCNATISTEHSLKESLQAHLQSNHHTKLKRIYIKLQSNIKNFYYHQILHLKLKVKEILLVKL